MIHRREASLIRLNRGPAETIDRLRLGETDGADGRVAEYDGRDILVHQSTVRPTSEQPIGQPAASCDRDWSRKRYAPSHRRRRRYPGHWSPDTRPCEESRIHRPIDRPPRDRDRSTVRPGPWPRSTCRRRLPCRPSTATTDAPDHPVPLPPAARWLRTRHHPLASAPSALRAALDRSSSTSAHGAGLSSPRSLGRSGRRRVRLLCSLRLR